MMNYIPLQSRELSWLSFNARVLEEARDSRNPLYERIRFLAIYSANLDEFYRVRVAGLRQLAAVDDQSWAQLGCWGPRMTLRNIQDEVMKQQTAFGKIWRSIRGELSNAGVTVLEETSVARESHREEMTRYFKTRLLGFLRPVFLDSVEPGGLFLENGKLYQLVTLQNEQGSREAIVNIPSDRAGRFLVLHPANGKQVVVWIDDIVRLHLPLVFPGYRVTGGYSIKINRDENVRLEDDCSGDFVRKIRQQLEKRKTGRLTRCLYDARMEPAQLEKLRVVLKLKNDELVAGGRYHHFSDLRKFPLLLGSDSFFSPMPPLRLCRLDQNDSIFQSIDEGDCLLHYPYQSYEYVLRFFNEAAIDSQVELIKVALYRISPDSLIANALMSAARNGKRVMVFAEVKARYDEENNLRWAEELEKAGVEIMYSLPGLKVHAKVAMVCKRKGNGDLVRYGYFSTGNFNEVTAEVYADEGLFTADAALTGELDLLFSFLSKREPSYQFNRLLVSQFNMKEALSRLIDREISHVREGRRGQIILKLNGIDDREFIQKLYQASAAGVEVTLLVRGICTVVPGVHPWSSRINIFRLVDRFLEHSRIMLFHNAGQEEVYLSSADWMHRNLNRRIEVAFPVTEQTLKRELSELLTLQLGDRERLCRVDSGMNNLKLATEEDQGTRAQYRIYECLKRHSAPEITAMQNQEK